MLSRSGVTGAETKAVMPPEVMIAKIKEYRAAPPILGFGISSPEQVKSAIQAGAAGAISGSAIVNIIEEHQNDIDELLVVLGRFVTAMKAATSI